MKWLTFIYYLVQIIHLITERVERNRIVSEIEQVERAKVVLKINQTLAAISHIPDEIRGLNEEELVKYVQRKGWFRD